MSESINSSGQISSFAAQMTNSGGYSLPPSDNRFMLEAENPEIELLTKMVRQRDEELDYIKRNIQPSASGMTMPFTFNPPRELEAKIKELEDCIKRRCKEIQALKKEIKQLKNDPARELRNNVYSFELV